MNWPQVDVLTLKGSFYKREREKSGAGFRASRGFFISQGGRSFCSAPPVPGTDRCVCSSLCVFVCVFIPCLVPPVLFKKEKITSARYVLKRVCVSALFFLLLVVVEKVIDGPVLREFGGTLLDKRLSKWLSLAVELEHSCNHHG